MTTTAIDPDIRAQAQRWFARQLAPDCSQAERAAFAQWRHADPAHDYAYRQVEAVWQHSGDLRDDPAIVDALQLALRPARKRPWADVDWMPPLAAAASLLIAVATVLWMAWPKPVPSVRYATSLGEQLTIALADGSSVVLDTDSELLVRIGQRGRDLTLSHGQADFSVQHDTSRPFVVHTREGSVTATGTRFQVRALGDVSNVTLLEGSVLVAAGSETSQQIALLPNQRIAIRSEGRLASPEALSEAELAGVRGWAQGNLVVKAWPLSTAVAEMNRYSATKLRLGDPALADIPVSGVFKAGDQKSFALALEYGWGIHVEQRSKNQEIVLTRR